MILAPIRLKFELVVNIIMEVVIFVNTNFKKNKKKFKRVVFCIKLWYSCYCRGDIRGET